MFLQEVDGKYTELLNELVSQGHITPTLRARLAAERQLVLDSSDGAEDELSWRDGIATKHPVIFSCGDTQVQPITRSTPRQSWYESKTAPIKVQVRQRRGGARDVFSFLRQVLL